jgi:hypothetical protein
MDVDPYRAPAVNPELGPDLDHPGKGWRIDGGRLLVRDHSRLPDICIYGGLRGERGRRIYLHLRRKGGRVRLVAFCSDSGRKSKSGRRALRGTALPLALGTVAWWFSWSAGFSPSSSLLISMVILCFSGIAASAWERSRSLRIIPRGGGWHELAGVHPAAVEALDRLTADSSERERS